VRKSPVFLLIAFSAALFMGCEKKPVAEVNGEGITRKMLELKIEERIREHKERGAVSVDRTALRPAVLEQMISETLLLQGARAANVAVPDEDVQREIHGMSQRMGEEKFAKRLTDRSLTIEEFTAIVRENLMKERFAEGLFSADDITGEEMLRFYKDSPRPFIKPESVNVRFIQTSFKLDAEALMKKLNKRSDFDRVADAAEEKGHTVSNYGWASPGMFSPEISDALRKLKPGGYGGPYKGREGYYIFMLKKRQKERPKTFEEASDEIRSLLLQKKRAAAVLHWVSAKRKQAAIVIN
jgi:parvulin-like peptidyl-prolyl isomerase